MYLNIAGIIITLIASIIIRNKLNKLGIQLDKDYYTASDFAVYAKDLPRKASKELLKQKLEEKYSLLKVVYINYCYGIDRMKVLTDRLRDLYRYKGIYAVIRKDFIN